jgi:hypothetical protein
MIDQLLRQLRASDPIARHELLAIVSEWTPHVDIVLDRLASNCIEADDLERFARSVRPTEKEEYESAARFSE